MSYLFWILFLLVVGAAIYWIIDWKQQHPNGE